MTPLPFQAAGLGRNLIPGDDPHIANVIALLPFNGSNGSTAFADLRNNVYTGAGNAQISTAQSKWGGSSLLLDGTGDYLSTTYRARFDADTEFTVEAWVRPAVNNTLKMIATNRPPSTGLTDPKGWAFYTSATGKLSVTTWDSGGNAIVNLAGGTTVTTTTWHHVAVTKFKTTWRLLLDGVSEGTATETAYGASANPLFVGRDPTNAARDFNGYMNDFRITRGIARYTGAYSVPTTAFPSR